MDEAFAECSEALRLDPDNYVAHLNLGTVLYDQGKMESATAEFRAAVRIKPDIPTAHSNLGNALVAKGKLEEAIAEYRKAVQLGPDDALSHSVLGEALFDQRKPEQALAEFQEALGFDPDSAMAHCGLGMVLASQDKLSEAVAEYETALRLRPGYAEAHCNLGHVFRRQGRCVEALAELKRGHDLGSKNPNWRYPSAEWVRSAERLVELDRELPTILAGKAKPSDAAAALEVAAFCHAKKLYGASVRFWSDALQGEPKLADDMQFQNRYNAACAAAMAGCGEGKDDPPLDDTAKARWRKQAIEWLKADLAAWSKILESGAPQARQAVSQMLLHWKSDTDLGGIRDPAALGKLPADEQIACHNLWLQVETLLGKSGSNPVP